MNTLDDNKVFSTEWMSDSRYFEPKSAHYFRAVTILAILSSLLLYFLGERLMIFLVWILFFVVYVRATVPPPKVKYSMGKFGIRLFDYYLNYQLIAAFSVVKKQNGTLLRLITHQNPPVEYSLVLPEDKEQQTKIIEFLKDRVPYLETFPKSEVEKLADFLGRVSGLA
jgi:hypothetical protein